MIIAIVVIVIVVALIALIIFARGSKRHKKVQVSEEEMERIRAELEAKEEEEIREYYAEKRQIRENEIYNKMRNSGGVPPIKPSRRGRHHRF